MTSQRNSARKKKTTCPASKKTSATRTQVSKSARKRRPKRADTVMNIFVFGIAVFLSLCAINLIGLTDYAEQPKIERVSYQVGDPQSFFDTLGPIAAKYESKGIYPSVMLAQAALESDYGESQLSFDYNNYFGIKAHDNHRSIKLTTTEYYSGTATSVRDYFCVYSSPADCFEDYAELITSNKNYSEAVGAVSPAIAARALQAGGYATDPSYASKVISIINEYNLTRYDPGYVPGSSADKTDEDTAEENNSAAEEES